MPRSVPTPKHRPAQPRAQRIEVDAHEGSDSQCGARSVIGGNDHLHAELDRAPYPNAADVDRARRLTRGPAIDRRVEIHLDQGDDPGHEPGGDDVAHGPREVTPAVLA